MAYNAIVAKLDKVYEHPNADRLQLAEVLGTQVVVGLEAKGGDIGIYFPADGQLSEEYCLENDLFPRYEEVDGKTVKVGGGMFDPKNRRVRAQNLRSVKSDGFFTSLESVVYTGVNLEDLYVGYQFDELNGHKICNKYFTPKTQSTANQKSSKKIMNLMFHPHVDTKQFHYNLSEFKTGDIVYLTEKVHGTSARSARVMVPTERKWYNPLTWFQQDKWEVLHGSRRVVLGSSQDNNGGFYGTNEFRFKAAEPLENNLMKGETIYYEIVGYVDENTRIMPPHSTESLKKDVELKELLGGTIPKHMEYNYNCISGQNDIYVYRITQTNIDGESVDLSWPQVKRRCRELGVKHVVEYPDKNFFMIKDRETGGYGPDLDELTSTVSNYEDMLSMIDNSHISEGVGVRVEHADGTVEFFKAKSYWFRVMEGIIKSDENYVDLEESS